MKLTSRFARKLWGKEKWYDYPINLLEDAWRAIKPYKLLNYLKNFKKFNKMAWSYYCWDSTFSIEVLCTVIEDNAKVCRNGMSMRAEQTYRRGMAMSGYLRKAYLDDYTYPSLSYLLEKNPFLLTNGRMTHEYNTPKELFEKLYKLARDKELAIETERKKEAWEYVHKYIEHLWD